MNDLFPYSHDQIHYPEIGAQKEVEVDVEVEREHLSSGTIRGIAGVGSAGDPDDRGEFLETSNQPGSPTDYPEEPPHILRPPGHPRSAPTEGELHSGNVAHAPLRVYRSVYCVLTLISAKQFNRTHFR